MPAPTNIVNRQIDLQDYYKPHGGQEPLHQDTSKVKVLEVGRRWGKSRFALGELIRVYIEAQDTPVSKDVVPPFHAWIVAPSYPQSRQVWNELLTFIPHEFIAPAGVKQDEHIIHLGNPSMKIGKGCREWGLIEVKSAHDPDTLQTAGLDFLWVTEAQDVPDKAFEKLLPTLRSPERLSRAIYEGIPPTYSDHWFHRVYMAGVRGTKDMRSFNATSFANPLLTAVDKAEIESDQDLLPSRVWRRMYMAEFAEGGGYFANIQECINGDLLPGPVAGVEYVGGLDLGRKLDPSVLIIMDANARKVVGHIAWDQGAPWVMQREGVMRETQRWNLTRLVIDATGMGGDIFTSELAEAGMPVEPYIFGPSSREALLQGLLVATERETIHFPNVPSMLRQLRAFQYRKTPSGNWRAEAPNGENDDEVFALGLALTACAPALSVYDPNMRPWRRSRYVPTQEEANNGGMGTGFGSRWMQERRRLQAMERFNSLEEVNRA